MSLEYIFPDHTRRNRTIAIVVECVAAFLAIGLIVWAIWYYRGPVAEAPVTQETVDDLVAQRKAWLEQPNIGEPLSVTQIEDRKQFVGQAPVTSTPRLSPEQIRSRQTWVESI